MGFREFNRNKNLYVRKLKARAGKYLFDRKLQNAYDSSKLPEIKKVLYLRNDNKLGDMMVSTLAFREMKKRLPGVSISVIAGPSTKDFIKNNPNVDKVYVYKRNFFKIIKLGKKLQKENFDLYIDMDEANTIESLMLLWLIKPKYALGFNRQEFKSYDISIPFEFDQHHITERHQAVFETLGIVKKGEEIDKTYDIVIPPNAVKQAKVFMSKLPKAQKNVLFNMFAASRRRNFSLSQVLLAAQKLPDCNFILVGPYSEIKKEVEGKTIPPNVIYPNKKAYQNGGFFLTLALVKDADIIVTPDTSVVHAASAFNKPTLALYNITDPANITKWAPLSTSCIILTTDTDFNKFNVNEIVERIKDYDPGKPESINNCTCI